MRLRLSPLAAVSFGLIFSAFLISCAGTGKIAPPLAAAPSVTSEESSDLSWTEAQARKARVSEIVYDLNVDVMSAMSKEVEANFTGQLTLRFQLKDVAAGVAKDGAKDLRLDFSEGEVKSLVVNGKSQDLAAKKKYWISLPAAALKEGANEVRIEYAHAFSRTGEGLHRFRDPADGKIYLYTQFETYDANRFMPCFDQPDLRSVLNLSVTAPKEWQVVSSALETMKVAKGAGRHWVFAPSPKISTYLFSLHAGPYFVFADKFKRADRSTIPLRIMVRPSLKNFLKQADWFKTTKDGIAFYENYFGAHYPFGKLDQLVVPEFNSGGMENVGAITYTENVLPRAQLTRKLRRGISSLLLHEIAHMWFGDLVTMAWWNNLWLNESFATYMSALAQSEATEYKEVWQTFGASVKARAYVEDAMVTTHPIEAPINTVKEAMTNFDAITYNKGASVLKQLNYFMTANDFREGIRDYFKTYSFQNTTLEQFIGSLQKHTKKDLGLWSDRWLRQSGADLVYADWKCDGDRLKKVLVTLESAKGRKPRPQSLEIGLYGRLGSSLDGRLGSGLDGKLASGLDGKPGAKTVVQSRVRAEFDGSSSSQTTELKGDWNCPAFVYPNAGDHGYVMVKLDSKSLEFLTKDISNVDDALTRSLAWSDLWLMVRETQISLKAYVDIVAKNFATEKDEITLLQILSSISGRNGSILGYWPSASETSKAERAKFVLAMENEFVGRMKNATSGSDEEKLWYDAFAQIAETPTGTEQLYRWYAAGKFSNNFPVDLERGWGISKTLARYGHSKVDVVLAQMRKKDSTDRGLKNALSVEASVPKLDVKQKWIGEFTGPDASKTHSLDQSESVLFSLFPIEQRPLKLKFSNDFASYLEKNRKSEDYSRVGVILATLMPLDCDGANSLKFKEKVNSYSDINPSFRKNFLMSLEEDERCQRVRARSTL